MKINVKGAEYPFDGILDRSSLDDLCALEDAGVNYDQLRGAESTGAIKLLTAFAWLCAREHGEKRGYIDFRRSLRIGDVDMIADEEPEAAPDPTEAGESSTRQDDDVTAEAEPVLSGSAA